MPKLNKKHQYIKNGIIFFIIVMIIILLSYIITIISNNDKTINNTNDVSINVSTSIENIVKSENEEELNRIKQMSERNRIEYYISNFIKDIETGKIEKAYNVLNKKFKQNYFSSEKSFKDYTEKKFTKMLDIDYTNFERNGDIYVVWLTITDAINGKKDSGEEITFVVKETDFNDFELSFSVN